MKKFFLPIFISYLNYDFSIFCDICIFQNVNYRIKEIDDFYESRKYICTSNSLINDFFTLHTGNLKILYKIFNF